MRLYILVDFISLKSMLLSLEYWKYDVSSLLLPIYLIYSNSIASHLINSVFNCLFFQKGKQKRSTTAKYKSTNRHSNCLKVYEVQFQTRDK